MIIWAISVSFDLRILNQKYHISISIFPLCVYNILSNSISLNTLEDKASMCALGCSKSSYRLMDHDL